MRLFRRCAVLLTGLALLTTGSAFQQEGIQSVQSPPPVMAANSLALAAQFRTRLAKARPGTIVNAGPGFYNFGNTSLLIPRGVEVRGAGADRTVFFSTECNSSQQPHATCAFELSDKCVVANLTIQHDYPPEQEGEAIGWSTGPDATAGHCSAKLKNLRINFRQWGIYNWGGPNIHTEVNHCALTGWGNFISNNVTGSSAGSMDVDTTIFIGDMSRIVCPGRPGMYMHFVRVGSGVVRLRNCQGRATGSAWDAGVAPDKRDPANPNQMYAMWIIPNVQNYAMPLGSNQIDAYKCDFRLTPGGCPDVKDAVTPPLGVIRTFLGSGSELGPNAQPTGRWLRAAP